MLGHSVYFRTKLLDCWNYCSIPYQHRSSEKSTFRWSYIESGAKANATKMVAGTLCLSYSHSNILFASSKMTHTMSQKLTITIIQKKRNIKDTLNSETRCLVNPESINQLRMVVNALWLPSGDFLFHNVLHVNRTSFKIHLPWTWCNHQ